METGVASAAASIASKSASTGSVPLLLFKDELSPVLALSPCPAASELSRASKSLSVNSFCGVSVLTSPISPSLTLALLPVIPASAPATLLSDCAVLVFSLSLLRESSRASKSSSVNSFLGVLSLTASFLASVTDEAI